VLSDFFFRSPVQSLKLENDLPQFNDEDLEGNPYLLCYLNWQRRSFVRPTLEFIESDRFVLSIADILRNDFAKSRFYAHNTPLEKGFGFLLFSHFSLL
jgi:hypothetical protein